MFWGTHVKMWRFSAFSGTDWHTLKMGTESVPEMSENLHILTRLSAQEYFFKLITARASRLITMFTFNQEVIFVAELLKKWAEMG